MLAYASLVPVAWLLLARASTLSPALLLIFFAKATPVESEIDREKRKQKAHSTFLVSGLKTLDWMIAQVPINPIYSPEHACTRADNSACSEQGSSCKKAYLELIRKSTIRSRFAYAKALTPPLNFRRESVSRAWSCPEEMTSLHLITLP